MANLIHLYVHNSKSYQHSHSKGTFGCDDFTQCIGFLFILANYLYQDQYCLQFIEFANSTALSRLAIGLLSLPIHNSVRALLVAVNVAAVEYLELFLSFLIVEQLCETEQEHTSKVVLKFTIEQQSSLP
jgi:hypothetical protein